MDELISRQAVLDALEWKWAGEAAIKAIKNIPSAQSDPKWIPVTERLPEDGRYLCTYENGGRICVDIGRVVGGEWNDWYVKPIAWMPLPKPYERSEE